jgi:hypothetical protein
VCLEDDVEKCPKPSLPPLSDPSLWWIYRHPHTVWNNSIQKLSSWSQFEQIGDKIASSVFYHLMESHGIPFGIAHSFHQQFASNSHWEKFSSVIGIPIESCLSKREPGDAFEVFLYPCELMYRRTLV